MAARVVVPRGDHEPPPLSHPVRSVPAMYHPFRHLRSLGETVTFSVEPTPGDKPAWWSPASSHILMRPGLSQAERRCYMAHELAHRDLNHSGECRWRDGQRQTRRQEIAADQLAARRLITREALVAALCWSDDREEVAEALWVTVHMLECRLEHMFGGERVVIATELRRRMTED